MKEFLNKLNEEAEKLAKLYMNEDDVDKALIMLEEIDRRLSILANAQALETSSITAAFTKQMQEQAKNIDFNKIDLNGIMKQFGGAK